jgi:hypothetical protein
LHVFYPLQYLAVAAHPPGSSYHKLGMPLIGRGIIQVWCLLSPFEDAHSCQSLNACNTSSRKGRPRKIPDGNNSVGSSSNPPKPRGRPRKIPDGGNAVGSSPNPPKPRGRPRKRPIDLLEPAPKRPRGRPRKNLLPVAKVENSSLNSRSQDIVLFYPLPESTVIPNDLPLPYIMPTAKSTPGRGRGRPRKNPIDKMSASSGTTLTKDVCTVPSPTTVTRMEPKRKRGRPRKYPVPSSIRSISATEMESGKDTTCQSVDHTACTESDANLSIVAVDAPLPITSSTATYEDISQGERDRRLTTPKSDDHLALVENCVEGTCSRKGSEQHKKLSASNKSNSMSIGIEACAMDRCSISTAMQTSRSDGMANEAVLIGFKNGNVGCEVMKVNEKDIGNTSHCNTENGQAKQVSPICQNNSIDEEEAAELLHINESKEDDNKLSSIENSKSYPIPKDIALPRVVLCLAHNGKVAWDIKWKPLIPNQSGQESCLGFLAVLLGNGSLEV